MSNDPYINSALFNFCNKLDDGPRTSVPSEPRSMEDLAWLKQALAAIEAPDKILKRHLQIIEIGMGWYSLGGGKKDEKAEAAAANKGPNAPKPTALQLLANGTTPVTVDDVIASLDYLVEELEDINMATEFCLMNGPMILLNLLKVASATFVAPAKAANTVAAESSASAATATPNPSAGTGLCVVPQPTIEEQQAIKQAYNGKHIPKPCPLVEPTILDLKRNAEVRAAAALAIAHAVQQNPKAQEAFDVCNWGDVVIPILALEVDHYIHGTVQSPENAAKVVAASTAAGEGSIGAITGATVAALLHACSCMARENDDGTKDFIVRGGVVLLEHIIASPARVSAKILKRAMFLVEYFASVGISNKGLIEATANILMMTGSNQSVRVTSSSSQTNGAASDPIESSVFVADAQTKDDVQRVAATSILAILEKGGNVVTDILKPRGVGAYLAKALPLSGAPSDDVRWELAKKLEG